MSVEARFASVAADLVARDEAIEQGRMLHAPGLRTSGKFFAFATPDDIVVKLPAVRVQELIASGAGRPCAIRKGAPMREWVRLTPDSDQACAAYLIEGREFVARQQRR
ncbi:MAG: hypothetical protein H0W07_04840 [Chloroflexi bacterium]|nr:hypothetical protein [Chloroflexota bacterium]